MAEVPKVIGAAHRVFPDRVELDVRYIAFLTKLSEKLELVRKRSIYHVEFSFTLRSERQSDNGRDSFWERDDARSGS